MSSGGPVLNRRRVIYDPLPNPFNSPSRTVTATCEVVIQSTVLNGSAGKGRRSDAKLCGMLLNLCGDAEYLHNAHKGQMSPICQGTFVSYASEGRMGKKCP